MWFNTWITRNLNIFDKQIQKDFNITNLKKIKDWNLDIFLLAYCLTEEDEKEILEKAFTDNKYNEYWLYSFKMNWLDYVEYVSKSELSDGNYEYMYIKYRKLDEKEIQKENIYINQWWECPKCKESYYSEIDNKYTCLDCWYKWTEDDFFKNFYADEVEIISDEDFEESKEKTQDYLKEKYWK